MMRIRVRERDPAIHLTHKPGGVRQVEPFQLLKDEAVADDQFVDAAIEVAPDPDYLLKWIESILPRGKAGEIAPTMFKKDERRFSLEDAPDLSQGGVEVVDRAESKGAHDRVERMVREGKSPLGIELQPGDGNW